MLAYADDGTVFAATESSQHHAGRNGWSAPRDQPSAPSRKCNAIWLEAPARSDTIQIRLGEARIPITSSLVIRGQAVAFRKDSMPCFKQWLRWAWKAAHANSTLLRSTTTSYALRIRLLQALVKPCLLYGAESWKSQPGQNHRGGKRSIEMVS